MCNLGLGPHHRLALWLVHYGLRIGLIEDFTVRVHVITDGLSYIGRFVICSDKYIKNGGV